jgi:RimK family alpha-L-glutamate ligase
VPGGTLEQVILRLDVLHALRMQQVPVYNDARAIERTVDKAMTSFVLHQAGLPTPPTWVMEDIVQCRQQIAREWAQGHEVVLKPLFGSQGEGLVRLAAGMPLPDLDAYRGVAYLQRFVPGQGGLSRDFRVFVIGGRADCAMARYGLGWINNVAQGARCEPLHAVGELAELAVAATRALDMDYAGVDLIAGPGGRLQVLEVNSVPAWHGLQSVTAHRVADRLAEDFLSRRVLPAMQARLTHLGLPAAHELH